MSDLREKAVEVFCRADSGTRYVDGSTLEAIHAVVDVCMEEAARIVEKEHCELCAADALRALRGDEGGVDRE